MRIKILATIMKYESANFIIQRWYAKKKDIVKAVEDIQLKYKI